MSLAELLEKKKAKLNNVPPPPEKNCSYLIKEGSSNVHMASIEGFNRSKLKEVNKNIRGEVIKVSKYRAGSAIEDDEDRTEYRDSMEEIDRKVEIVADLVKSSKYFVAYTGAGISTSAGLADFRGEKGIWTMLETTGKVGNRGADFASIRSTIGHKILTHFALNPLPTPSPSPSSPSSSSSSSPPSPSSSSSCEVPLRYLISTNCDGLHLRSGFPIDQLAELHGNAFKEKCEECGRYQFQEEMVYVPRTEESRKCNECNGRVKPTCVAFGDELPSDQFKSALEHSKRSDLAIVMGTSMKVSPACNLPEWSYRNKGNLIICNLQKTPYDKYAKVVLHCETDLFLAKLFQKLYFIDHNYNDSDNNNNENDYNNENNI